MSTGCTRTIKWPQIGLWDRLKAEPLRIVLKAMDFAQENGSLKTDSSKPNTFWSQDAIYDEYYTYCWAHFSVRDVGATIFLDNSIFEVVKAHWLDAVEALRIGNHKSNASTKGKGKGKGKMKRFDTEAGDYPFDYKLAAVQDWRYDDTLNKYRQDVEQMES